MDFTVLDIFYSSGSPVSVKLYLHSDCIEEHK